MDSTKLNEIEAQAVEVAASRVCLDLAKSILETMWNDGIRNLEDCDIAKLKKVSDAQSKSPIFRKFLIEYSNVVRVRMQMAK